LKPLKLNIGLWESTKLTAVSSFVNFFTPVVGGASARALYLKREYGLTYSSFVGVVYANYLIIFLVSFLFGLAGLFTISGAISSGVGRTLGTFFSAGVIGSLLFMLLGHKLTGNLRRLNFRNKILKKIAEKVVLVDEGWESIRTNRRAIIMMSLWSAGTMASVTLIYWAAMRCIGLNTGLSVTLIFSALAIVGLLFNITPGSVGIREAIYASIYSISGVGAKQVVAFSLVDRSTQLILLGIGWMLFGRMVMKGIIKNKAKA